MLQCVVMLSQDSFYRGLTPEELADVACKCLHGYFHWKMSCLLPAYGPECPADRYLHANHMKFCLVVLQLTTLITQTQLTMQRW